LKTPPKRRLSIRAQVLSAVLLAVTVVASTLLLFFGQRQRTQAREALEARVAGTADMLAVGVALGLRSPDFTGIARAMSWARRDPAILWAVVVDSTDQPLARYAPPGRTAPTPPKQVTLSRVERRADVLTIAVPVLDADERLGTLHLGVSMAAAESAIRRNQETALLAVVGISLLAALVGVITALRITRPIEELRDAAVNLREGAIPEIPVRGSTETAELGRAFRQMAGRIRESLDTLTAQATELAESRDIALGATQAKSLFLATMSHELRTPMTGVLGMLDLLMRTSLSTKQQTFARTARDSAESLLVLIDDILDFSKIEAGKLTLEQVAFDPRAVADDVASLLAERAHRKQLTLVCDVAADVPAAVIGDPTRLRQILLNLGGNAVKFTATGEVRIEVRVESASAAGTVIRYAVHDTGPGMSADAQSRIFSAFTQAEISTTRRFGGTGLGLSICRGLVELMGGSIDVTSAVDRGSTFSVRVPFVLAPDAAATADQPALRGRRVLLVHRPGTQRAVVTRYLSDAGATVREIPALDALPSGGGPLDADAVVLEVAQSHAPVAEQVARVRAQVGGAHLILLVTLDSPVLLDDTSGAVATVPLPARRQALVDAVRAPARAVPAPQPRDAVLPERSGRRILVAEDHPVNREIAQHMLRELGHEVLLAEDGAQALALLAAQPVDLVLMDCQMPVMDGFDATRELRRRERGGTRLPVVALTANAVKGDREACLAAGMDDYLAKPYRRAELAAICERWLSAPVPSARPRTPAHGADTESPIDALLRRLQEQIGEDDEAFARELLGRFMAVTEEILVDMRRAALEADRRNIQLLAHRLKGSSATVGADDVADAAARLEQLPSSADDATVDALLEDVVRSVEAIREVVHAG
jgi:signal transduction histidine kinase/CheY-like chemotaxis protein/HPt (histidine-containing phosphotransfer) domain-containing protein